MSGAAVNPSVLRLVNDRDAGPLPERNIASQGHPRRGAHAALDDGLDAADPRWVLAVRATMALEGGSAAILRPEQRRKLVQSAIAMGLRPFDAALVIAIAQDAARAGEALSGEPQSRLALVRPARVENQVGPGLMLMISGFVGMAFFVLMRAWLLP